MDATLSKYMNSDLEQAIMDRYDLEEPEEAYQLEYMVGMLEHLFDVTRAVSGLAADIEHHAQAFEYHQQAIKEIAEKMEVPSHGL